MSLFLRASSLFMDQHYSVQKAKHRYILYTGKYYRPLLLKVSRTVSLTFFWQKVRTLRKNTQRRILLPWRFRLRSKSGVRFQLIQEVLKLSVRFKKNTFFLNSIQNSKIRFLSCSTIFNLLFLIFKYFWCT